MMHEGLETVAVDADSYEALRRVAERYSAVSAVDGSTLDALIRKMGLLKDLPENLLAGRMAALLDLCSRLEADNGNLGD